MTPEDYQKKMQQKPIGGFKDPSGEYNRILYQLQIKFRLETRAALMKKLIDDGLESENIKIQNENAKRYNDNIKKIYEKRKIWSLWVFGFNMLFLLLHLVYSFILK